MDETILDVLACPLCKGRLVLNSANKELICRIDRLAYPIEADIPVMIPERARRLTDGGARG